MHRLTPQKAKNIIQKLGQMQEKLPELYRLEVAEPKDIESILVVAKECFAYNTPSKREIAYYVQKAHGVIFILKNRDNKTVAYTLMEAHSRKKSLYINTTAILAECRGLGLGKFFYEFNNLVARQLEVSSAWGHVKEDNYVTIHLLEKNGFKKYRVETAYYDDGLSAYLYKNTYPAGA
jgi:ribosomal protein S18 acetylase RimI-like enzyme